MAHQQYRKRKFEENFLKDQEKAIQYSDGNLVEAKILELLKGAQDLASHVPIASKDYHSWPVRYHLCPERSNLFRHFCFEGLSVLELGAGMGGVSRYLAENCKHLTVVEGTHERNAANRERLRNLTNWESYVCNIQDFGSTSLYDVVCVVGVLEYSEMFIQVPKGSDQSPFDLFLQKALSFLKPQGLLILAIENQLGIKYWSGASEDHTARLFEGITGYSPERTPKTFSRKKLIELFNRHELDVVDEFFPFPDYKIPNSVLSAKLIDQNPKLASEIGSMHPFQDYTGTRHVLFPDLLSLPVVAQAGLMKEFSNSFLFVGSRSKYPSVREHCLVRMLKDNEIAWHYTISGRSNPTTTIFSKESPSEGSVHVVKSSLLGRVEKGSIEHSFGNVSVTWKAIPKREVCAGIKMIVNLSRFAYREEWNNFENRLKDFLNWVFKSYSGSHPSVLQGKALDVVVINIMESSEKMGSFSPFDIEWELNGELPKSWFILRNILGLQQFAYLFNSTCPFKSFAELYVSLCSYYNLNTDIDKDMNLEASLQVAVSGRLTVQENFEDLKNFLFRPFPDFCLPKRAEEEFCMRLLPGQLNQAHGAIQELKAELAATTAREQHLLYVINTPTHKIAARMRAFLQKRPWMKSILLKVFLGTKWLMKKVMIRANKCI